jgi:4-hydroxythreonine-4-phosphate dehydrogenase
VSSLPNSPRLNSPRLKPRLAITMGDPGGIGPEVVLKAIVTRKLSHVIEPLLVGDRAVWEETARGLGLRLRFSDTQRRGAITVATTSELEARHRVPGPARNEASAAARGEAAYRAILEGVRLVQAGQAAALATAPINKAHLNAAGHDFPGHTELLAQLCGNIPVRMMMVGAQLRVVLVTTHVAIAQLPRRLSRQGVLQTVVLTGRALRRQFGIATPRLAVCGLNPHAGESGLFGDEEVRVIAPAVRAARRGGLDVVGPLAADGVFAQVGNNGVYDAVVCMYHDQGLAPFKFVHFADGVNFTVGLPFVRTSPDHGTAFDVAGSGQADPRSMAAALRLAAQLSGSGEIRSR